MVVSDEDISKSLLELAERYEALARGLRRHDEGVDHESRYGTRTGILGR
jgi:hypothetical protein